MEPINALAPSYVRSLMERDPGSARELATKAGVDYAGEVCEYLERKIDHVEEDDIWFTSGSHLEKLRRLAEESGDLPRIINHFRARIFYPQTLPFLCALFPEIVVERYEEAAKILLQHSRIAPDCLNFPQVRSAVEPLLIQGMNSDPSIMTIDDETLITKIRRFWGFGKIPKNPGLDFRIWRRYLIYQIVECYLEHDGEDRYFEEIHLDDLSPNQLEDVCHGAICQLLQSDKPIRALGLAKRMALPNLELALAGLAYGRCCERHQYKDAAQLAKTHDIPDYQQAAQKELDRLCESRHSGNPQALDEIMTWALNFGLSLSEDVARGYAHLRDRSASTVERLIQTGNSHLARDFVQDHIEERRTTDFLPYLSSENALFMPEEAADLLSHHLISLSDADRHQRMAELDQFGLGELRGLLGQRLARIWLPEGSRAEIEKFYARYYNPDFLPQSALREAGKLADEGQWPEFLHICREWNLTDQLKAMGELEKLLPKSPAKKAPPPGTRLIASLLR